MAKVKRNRGTKQRVWNRRAYCIALLRRGFLRSAIRQQCLVANRKRKRDCKTGRTIWYVKCKTCKKWWKQGVIKVDHIDPVTPIGKTLISLDEFAERLYCDIKNLQCLCKKCHDFKTARERKQRRKNVTNK